MGVAVAALAVAPAGSGWADPMSAAGFGTAVVDGVVAPGEYAHATRIDFNASIARGAGGGSVPATLRLMNDGRNLYIALQVARPTGASEGWLSANFLFSPDRRGVRDLLDAFFGGSGWSFLDMSLPTATADTSAGGTNDVVGAANSDATSTTIELSHPLAGPDQTHDFVLRPGDPLGVNLDLALQCVPPPPTTDPDCSQPESQVSQSLVVAARPRPLGVVRRAWMSVAGSPRPVARVKATKVLTANFLFGVLPAPGAQLQVRWFRNGAGGEPVPESRVVHVVSRIISDGGISPGAYRAVLKIRPPGQKLTAVATARVTVG
jgi:hypothetical protein